MDRGLERSGGFRTFWVVLRTSIDKPVKLYY